MFTGLIEGKGRVQSIRHAGGDTKLVIFPLFPMDDVRLGESVAVNGVCLTVTETGAQTIAMDVSGETVSRSTLGLLKERDEVNLERALRLSDRLGGHLVSGHVDGIGRIVKKDARHNSWFLRIGLDKKLSRYTIEKGSIAVDGISLTINRCGNTFFDVNIIPQTGRETTLLDKRVGEAVNIEVDLIGKYVEKLFRPETPSDKREPHSGVSPEMLSRYGFGE